MITAERIDKNDFFRQATVRICGSLNIDRSLKNCFDYLEQIIPMSVMYLHLFDPDHSVIRKISAVIKDTSEIFYDTIPIPESIKHRVFADWSNLKDAIIINRPESDPVSKMVVQYINRPDLSFIMLPLKLEGDRLGSISIYTKGKDQYSQVHADLFSLLNEPFSIAMSNVLRHQEILKLKDILADDNKYLNQELLRISGDEIIGKDKGLKGVMDMVRQVAPLNNPVLLLGETGSGKEVIANAIHYSSVRKNHPFIKVNCGAIPENLVDSELFGHEKGAFTGAIAQKRGRFERAHKGTIFLDEIGELPPMAQIRMLRVLQDNEIERVGGTESITVDTRIISATHRNLETMVANKQFREDLWYRLNVFPITIPPLRQRQEDIPELVRYFLERKLKELKMPVTPIVSADTIEKLKSYRWPGNVRELENTLERALIQSRGQTGSDFSFMVETILQPCRNAAADEPDNDNKLMNLDDAMAVHIQHALKITRGKIYGSDGAAKLLGVNPNTLRSRMDRLEIRYRRKEVGV
ncbi:MAG: sigma 54-interacting transcriptional regulator [Desulfobacterales bacterium]|nr:sigma 54-interacting transcriptional regulator [Desulfobacterales bacterium]